LSFEATVNFRWGVSIHVKENDFELNPAIDKLIDKLESKIIKEKRKGKRQTLGVCRTYPKGFLSLQNPKGTAFIGQQPHRPPFWGMRIVKLVFPSAVERRSMVQPWLSTMDLTDAKPKTEAAFVFSGIAPEIGLKNQGHLFRRNGGTAVLHGDIQEFPERVGTGRKEDGVLRVSVGDGVGD